MHPEQNILYLALTGLNISVGLGFFPTRKFELRVKIFHFEELQ